MPHPKINNQASPAKLDLDNLADPQKEEDRVLSDWENDVDDEADLWQLGGARTPKRIKLNEMECPRGIPDAILCKTYAPADYCADRHTVLFSFREMIQRELCSIGAFDRGIKA